MALTFVFGGAVMFSIDDHRYGLAAGLFMCFLAGVLEIFFNTTDER
jgi:uncharacterized cupin superfamily protein